MTELTGLILALTMFLIALIVLILCVYRQLTKYVTIMTGTTTDKAVDEFFRKSCIIAIDSFKHKNHQKTELEKLVIERASGIVSDVLLQHGIQPRSYNLEGLCRVALYRLGFLRYGKGVLEDGKS